MNKDRWKTYPDEVIRSLGRETLKDIWHFKKTRQSQEEIDVLEACANEYKAELDRRKEIKRLK